LVPQGTYAELPGVLASRYEGLCDGISLDAPSDPADDDDFTAMLESIKTIPGRITGGPPA
jgi:hypothetical protein